MPSVELKLLDISACIARHAQMKLVNEYKPESMRKIRFAKTNCDICLTKSSVKGLKLLKVFRR